MQSNVGTDSVVIVRPQGASRGTAGYVKARVALFNPWIDSLNKQKNQI